MISTVYASRYFLHYFVADMIRIGARIYTMEEMLYKFIDYRPT